MRDYTDFMNMTPTELAAYARDVAGNDLVLALAHQLGPVGGGDQRITGAIAAGQRGGRARLQLQARGFAGPLLRPIGLQPVHQVVCGGGPDAGVCVRAGRFTCWLLGGRSARAQGPQGQALDRRTVGRLAGHLLSPDQGG